MRTYIRQFYLNGSLMKYAIGKCEIECETYDNTLKAYVGSEISDSLTNFIRGSIVIPIEGSYDAYNAGALIVSMQGNWIHVQSTVATKAHVKCLMLYI